MRGVLAHAYERSPLWLDRPMRAVRRHALPLLRSDHPLRQLVGTGCDGRPARVLLAGVGTALDIAALARRFFTAAPEETALGTVSGSALRHRLVELSAEHDLVLARTWNRYADRAAQAGLLTMPDLPEMRLAIGSGKSALAEASNENRRIARRCEEAGFRLHVTVGGDRFEEFYQGHHLPFVRGRHGTDLVASAAPALRRRLRRGGITWATLDGEPLFAVAYEIVDGTFRELVAGTPDGRLDPLVQRARAASRAGHIRLAAEYGLRWLNMGGCRPWLSDGMLASKRAWGGELVPRAEDLRSLLVGWRRWTPAVAQFLAEHPLLLRAPDGFAALTVARQAHALGGLQSPGIRALHLVAREGLTTIARASGVEGREVAFDGEPSSARLAAILEERHCGPSDTTAHRASLGPAQGR